MNSFRRRLLVTSLESRIAPATFTVMNLNDSGADSLRDCISKANAGGGDTVNFKAGLTGTIALTTGEIAVSKGMTITGPGSGVITLSGNNANRIFNTQSAATNAAISISGFTIASATASSFGGAILAGDESLTFDGCVFSANKSSTKAGGAIGMLGAGNLTARDCTFTNNVASTFAGAIVVAGFTNTTLLQRCTFSGNTAGSGGAMYVYDNLIMESCTLSGNSATTGRGGAIYCNASGSITQSTLSGNSAATDGGAVSLFIHVSSESLTIRNSTITNNSAGTGSGGGIRRVSTIGSISIESSIISGNINAAAPDISSAGSVTMKTSAVGSGTGFTKTDQGGNLPFQPHANLKLGALANNGGAMLTQLPATDSPLIDVGSNPAALTTDQRGTGFPRLVGFAVDIGAIEGLLSVVVSNTNDSGAGSLRQAILNANALPGADTVTFDAAVFATQQSIKLTTGEIAISATLTVRGPTVQVIIDGNANSRIFNSSSAPAASPIILRNLIFNNAKSNAQGGAILATDEALTLQFCAITNSKAPSGGAIGIGTGSLLIEDSTLTSNSSTNGDGGAITTAGAPLTIRRCALSGNSAAKGTSIGGFGGAINFDVNASLTLEDSTLSGNSSDATNGVGGGGAIYFTGNGANFLISNSTISGNSAPNVSGGAICWQSATSTLSIRNSTLTNNGAKNGGGIAVLGNGSISLNSTIVAGNSAPSPDLSFTSLSAVSGDQNLIGVADAGYFTLTGTGNLSGTKAAPLDAKLGPLANNGGPTLTHALLTGSPAFGHGSNPAGLINDQRGAAFPRLVGAAVDIGSVESASTAPAVVAFDGGPGVTTTGISAYNFTLTYSDGAAINVATLDDNDITVSGPAFPSGIAARFLSVNVNINGTPRTATYQVIPPAGDFTGPDSGSYSVSVHANEVKATSGQSVAPIVAGSFVVAIPQLLTVNATNDETTDTDGKTSLREAVIRANNVANTHDTITFDASVFATPQTILLSLGHLPLSDSIDLIGPAATLLIDAGGLSRHFFIDGPGALTINISQMTLTNGNNVSLSGGSIRITDEAVTLNKITFSNNTANSNVGGAVSVVINGAQVTIQDCVFNGNHATTQGGAINVSAGSVTVVRTTLSGNSADANGGAVYCFNASLTIDDCTVSGNTSNKTTAGNGGGGICFVGTGTLTVTNSTLSGNTMLQSGSGGGISFANFTGSALIQNSTITANNAVTAGGGIARVSGTSALTLQSTIVAGNLVAGANNAKSDISFDVVTAVAGTNNLVGIQDVSNNASLTGSSNQTGTLATPLNAKLGPLANNGGPTLTHALLAGSPAIDKGNNTPGLPFDQRGAGFPRVQSGAADVGAFELFNSVPFASATANSVTSPGGTVHTITVQYSDDLGINTASLDSSDITVNSPGGPIAVTFTGFTGAAGAVTAKYDMVPPGGSWDGLDSGTYSIAVIANQVFDTDTVPNSVPAGIIGKFTVSLGTTFVVNATNDEISDTDGKLSLREVLALANQLGPTIDTITFDPVVFTTPQTIILTVGTELAITDSVNIIGPAARVTVDANFKSRHFNIDGTTSLTVSLSGMTLTKGSTTTDGGSIRLTDDTVTLSNMTISNNTTTADGGALTATATTSNLTIQDCTISNNAATATDSQGGAINIDTTGTLTVTRCTISGNSAGEDGGGIYFFSGGSLTLTESTVSGNTSNSLTASIGGGGIYFFGTVGAGGFTITNSTISGNTMLQAGSGGGIVLSAFTGSALIQNSTIVGNNAVTAGGGIARTSGTGAVTLLSTIIAGNLIVGANNAKSDLSFDTASAVAGNNNLVGIQEASNNANLTGSFNLTGSLATPLDAKLGPLGNNGGLTLTHALASNSPAIDKGSNPASLVSDQRGTGFARSFNATDIGAFELQPMVSKVSVVQVNDGTAQRSRITSVRIDFNSVVTFNGVVASAFQLKRQSDNLSLGGFTATATNGAVTSVTLTSFSGSATDFGSLADGRYTLTVLASQISNFDGNGDGTPGDNFVLVGNPATNKLFRVFGDSDGNGIVDGIDFGAFRTAFNTNSVAFDFDGSGVVDGLEFGQFRQRFGFTI